MHAGARLESRGVVIGTAIAIIGGLVAIAALRDVNY
jgi:hypothetical protein